MRGLAGGVDVGAGEVGIKKERPLRLAVLPLDGESWRTLEVGGLAYVVPRPIVVKAAGLTQGVDHLLTDTTLLEIGREHHRQVFQGVNQAGILVVGVRQEGGGVAGREETPVGDVPNRHNW